MDEQVANDLFNTALSLLQGESIIAGFVLVVLFMFRDTIKDTVSTVLHSFIKVKDETSAENSRRIKELEDEVETLRADEDTCKEALAAANNKISILEAQIELYHKALINLGVDVEDITIG